jgi:translation initiation factor 1
MVGFGRSLKTGFSRLSYHHCRTGRSVLCQKHLHRGVSGDDFSSITGLPEELNIEDDLERSEQQVSIRVDERRYGKAMTIVEGLDLSDSDVSDLASDLKSQLATGGTVDDGRIELQGDHTDRLPDLLEDHGFTVEK